jgi:hypothetical protein
MIQQQSRDGDDGAGAAAPWLPAAKVEQPVVARMIQQQSRDGGDGARAAAGDDGVRAAVEQPVVATIIQQQESDMPGGRVAEMFPARKLAGLFPVVSILRELLPKLPRANRFRHT